MDSASRNKSTADDLDSTVLRHQVQRYFNELQQDADTPLHMDFLGMKRKVQASSIPARTPTVDAYLPKKIRFDVSTSGENSDTMSGLTKRNIPTNKSKIETSLLEQELSLKKAQIVELQQKIIQLQMKINETEAGRDQLEINLSHVQDACKSKIKKFEDKIEDLKVEVKQLVLRNAELAEENVRVKEEMGKWKLVFADEKLEHSRKNASLDQNLVEMQQQYESEIYQLKHELELANWESKKYQLEVEEAHSQLKLKEQATFTCNHESLIEQQQQVIQEMENALFAQRAAFSQSQEAKLAKIPQLEKELARLQQINKLYMETAANELLLKEQISSLQESLQRSKDERNIIPKLECEIRKLKDNIMEWETLSLDLLNVSSVTKVGVEIEEMRRKELKLTDDLGSLSVELKAVNRANLSLKSQIASLTAENRSKFDLEDRNRKLERKLIVVQKDRDHYRSVNEMYEREMTHIGAPSAASMDSNRMQELEALLDEYRKLVSPNETEVLKAEDSETIKELNTEKTQLSQQVQTLNKTIDLLKTQLEIASSRGINADTKVLHFTSNPLDNVRKQTMEQLAQLEKENASLRERMRLIEAGHSQNLTLLVGEQFDQGYTPERFKELEENLKSSQLKNQRMEEVFHKFCSDFRRGIFHLFGYQVDCDEGNYKLTSVYRESDDDFLSFKSAGDGLIVMDSPFIHTVDDLVQLHIHRQRSIPAFLAALTIELFSRRSMNDTTFPSMLST